MDCVEWTNATFQDNGIDWNRQERSSEETWDVSIFGGVVLPLGAVLIVLIVWKRGKWMAIKQVITKDLRPLHCWFVSVAFFWLNQGHTLYNADKGSRSTRGLLTILAARNILHARVKNSENWTSEGVVECRYHIWKVPCEWANWIAENSTNIKGYNLYWKLCLSSGCNLFACNLFHLVVSLQLWIETWDDIGVGSRTILRENIS